MGADGISNQYRTLAGGNGSVPAPLPSPTPPGHPPGSAFQEFYTTNLPTALNGPFRESGIFDNVFDSWFTSAAKSTLRNLAGRGIDKALQDSKYSELAQELIPQQAQKLGQWPTSVGQNALSYREFFNLGKAPDALKAERLVNPKAFEYHSTPWREVFQEGNYKEAVRQNFSGFGKEAAALGGETAWGYLKKHPLEFLKRTVVFGNLRPISTMLREGKNIGHGLASAFGLGMMMLDVLSATKDAYVAAKAQEDGSMGGMINTVFQTGKAFLAKGFKSITAWEIGTIGFTLGAALCAVECPGFWIPLLGGILTDALFSTITKRCLSTILPDPPKAA